MSKITTTVRYAALGALAFGIASAGLASSASAQGGVRGFTPGVFSNTTGEGALWDHNTYMGRRAHKGHDRYVAPDPVNSSAYDREGEGN